MQKRRLWNAVRSLRGKKDKLLPEVSQDDSDSPSFAKVKEQESESELEKRVRQWQSQSFLPWEFRSPASLTAGQNQDLYFPTKNKINFLTGDVDKVETGVLFHPDFADWDTIHHDQIQESDGQSFARTGADDLIQVLDDAKKSLSTLLVVPFCTNC